MKNKYLKIIALTLIGGFTLMGSYAQTEKKTSQATPGLEAIAERAYRACCTTLLIKLIE